MEDVLDFINWALGGGEPPNEKRADARAFVR